MFRENHSAGSKAETPRINGECHDVKSLFSSGMLNKRAMKLILSYNGV